MGKSWRRRKSRREAVDAVIAVSVSEYDAFLGFAGLDDMEVLKKEVMGF